METSQLIWIANQLTGFYMIGPVLNLLHFNITQKNWKLATH